MAARRRAGVGGEQVSERGLPSTTADQRRRAPIRARRRDSAIDEPLRRGCLRSRFFLAFPSRPPCLSFVYPALHCISRGGICPAIFYAISPGMHLAALSPLSLLLYSSAYYSMRRAANVTRVRFFFLRFAHVSPSTCGCVPKGVYFNKICPKIINIRLSISPFFRSVRRTRRFSLRYYLRMGFSNLILSVWHSSIYSRASNVRIVSAFLHSCNTATKLHSEIRILFIFIMVIRRLSSYRDARSIQVKTGRLTCAKQTRYLRR